MLMKLFSIVIVMVLTATVGYRAYCYYSHRGCQVQSRPTKWIDNKRYRAVFSLAVVGQVALCFWRELSEISEWFTFVDPAENVLANIIFVLVMAYGYYLALSWIVARLKAVSLNNAQADAKSQMLRCVHRCFNATGAETRLPCRNLNVTTCPCAGEWDVKLQVRETDVYWQVRDALAEMDGFGTTEISVPACRIVRKPVQLPNEVEQAYIGQIVRLIATKMPDGQVVRELRGETAKVR